MPRIPHRILLQARAISPLLPLLLRTCRTLPSARNELRWLQEHALVLAAARKGDSPENAEALLLRLCEQRGRGVPLQYLLGSQPFGELDIICRPGVLIPRPETEAYTSHLAMLLQEETLDAPNGLKILDICSGTGCISLLLYGLLSKNYPEMMVLGVDISDTALTLANENLKHNVAQGSLPQQCARQVSFLKADALSPNFFHQDLSPNHIEWDVIVSNPPYISETGFTNDTSRSVRNWEPKLALVPPQAQGDGRSYFMGEDLFYFKILETAKAAKARILLMEVGDMQQALRVAQSASIMGVWSSIEIWRDWPKQDSDSREKVEQLTDSQQGIGIIGSGHGRSVLCKR